MQIPVSTRQAVAFILILTGTMASVNDAPGQESVSVPVEKSKSFTVFKKDIDITTISKQSLYDEMLNTYKKQQEANQLYEICLDQVNSVQCWQMYGDDIEKSKQSFPYALRSIIHDPLYLVIRYPSVSVGSGPAEEKKKDFVVCLNPSVPNGYWQDINRFKPILKSTADVDSNDPKDMLKKKICDAYSMWQ